LENHKSRLLLDEAVENDLAKHAGPWMLKPETGIVNYRWEL